jgi:hypothetical protein
MRPLVVAALLTCSANLAFAQTPDLHRSGLPRRQADRLERLIEDPATRRFEGDATIRPDETVEGNVFLHRGILNVGGTVRGEIIVVDGDVIFDEGASVGGDVTVVGGSIRNAESAVLAGTVTEFGEGFGLLAQARRIHDGRDDWRGDWRADRDDWGRSEDRRWRTDFGSADFAVRVGANYNRVEGLPIQFGPDLRTGGNSPLRLEALAVWRTDVGPITNTERMGYAARLEQYLGRSFRIGASVRSTIDPIEDWNLDDIEATLATAMLHEDQRDYFQREGWSAYIRFAPRRSPLDLAFEYRDERHSSVAARDPWTLIHREDLWRDQPLVGEGRIRTINATASWDTRAGGDFAYRGWYLGATVSHGVDGSLTLPAAANATGTLLERPTYGSDFTAGLIDLRRYEPVGFGGAIGLRAVAGGSLDGKTLAPQFQHALGGAGTLPGYDLMSADCGARQAAVQTGGPTTPRFFYPSYGCDRFAMAQAEYRGGMKFNFGGDDEHDWNVNTDVNWTVFFDAARGWALGVDPVRNDTGTLYDAGLGFIVGGFGIYGAAPLNGENRAVRLFVRLGPRF